MSRVIYIGDVHGCLNELKILIEKVNPTKDDHLIFCGDLVDKGPDSPGVVSYVRNLKNETQVSLVLGNHEAKHARYRKQISEGKIPKMKYVEEIAAITNKLSQEDVEFLDSAQIQITVGDKIAVHAGISPALKYLPNHNQFISAKGRDLDLYRELTMVRYVNDFGRMIMLGKETELDQFWTERYDGRFGYVIYGHQPFINSEIPVMTKHTAGIDLGCVFGGYLCAFISPEEYITVKAFDKYASHFLE